jgi:hypothetical protein
VRGVPWRRRPPPADSASIGAAGATQQPAGPQTVFVGCVAQSASTAQQVSVSPQQLPSGCFSVGGQHWVNGGSQ